MKDRPRRGTTPQNPHLPLRNDYQSRNAWEDACWKKLLSTKAIELDRLITTYERRNIIMRASVGEYLRAGMSYRDIGRTLWCSPQTVSAIRKSLKETGYRSYANRGKTERKKKTYSSIHKTPRPSRPQGAPHKTKYGIVYW